MDLVNEFEVQGEPAAVWAACLDMPLVVKCLPGATLTRSIDAEHHEGTITVRIGPMQMEFLGQLHIVQSDPAQRQALIHTQWDEAKRRGAARGQTRLSVDADAQRPGHSQVRVSTSVQLSGQLAQYARGVGVLQLAASAITREFAAKLQGELACLAQASTSSSSEPQPPQKSISALGLVWQMFVQWLSRGVNRAQR